jgi:hypothetical protein
MAIGPIAGTAYLKYDGNQLPLKGNLTVSGTPFERIGMAGQRGFEGYYETPRVAWIEADISIMAEISIEKLENITDATVTADLINGHSYVLQGAYTKGPIDVNTHDGQFRIRWEGMLCDEKGPSFIGPVQP